MCGSYWRINSYSPLILLLNLYVSLTLCDCSFPYFSSHRPQSKDYSPRKRGGRGRAGPLTANWHNSISPLQTHRIPCEVSPLSRTRPPLLYLSSRGKVRSKVTAGKKITKPSRTRLPSPSFRQCFHLLQLFQAVLCTHATFILHRSFPT